MRIVISTRDHLVRAVSGNLKYVLGYPVVSKLNISKNSLVNDGSNLHDHWKVFCVDFWGDVMNIFPYMTSGLCMIQCHAYMSRDM